MALDKEIYQAFEDVVGKRNSRHVHQTVSDIENLANAISKVTKMKIKRANHSWIYNF